MHPGFTTVVERRGERTPSGEEGERVGVNTESSTSCKYLVSFRQICFVGGPVACYPFASLLVLPIEIRGHAHHMDTKYIREPLFLTNALHMIPPLLVEEFVDGGI